MTKLHLVLRTIWFFRYTNLALLFGIAIGTAVLNGSLIVGDSIHSSLCFIVEKRLGDISHILISTRFFQDTLPDRLKSLDEFKERFTKAEPLIVSTGSCNLQGRTEIATGLHIFAQRQIDEQTCVVSEKLARDLNLSTGKALVFRIDNKEKPSDAPVGLRKNAPAVLEAKIIRIAKDTEIEGSFSLYGSQRPPKNAWVSLYDMQKAYNKKGYANCVFVSERENYETGKENQRLDELLNKVVGLDDYGLRVVPLDSNRISLESRDVFLGSDVERACEKTFPLCVKVFVWLANTVRDIRTNHEFPYSMIAGISALPDGAIAEDEMVLNQWAASDVKAIVGDPIEITYYTTERDGLLKERSARFKLARVISDAGVGVDKTLVPDFSGITDQDTISTWKPPADFVLDLKRIREIDEDYWKKFKAAPKAFINLRTARRLWGSRYGELTSVRFTGIPQQDIAKKLLDELKPMSMGLILRPIRYEQIQSARTNTDFGGLFIGFSFFLMISASFLVALLMSLSIEQRLRQIGLMFALGFTGKCVRNIFLLEDFILLLIGSFLGIAMSAGYAWLMVLGLKTVWNDAIGTKLILLNLSPATIATGFTSGFVIGAISIWKGIVRLKVIGIKEIISGNILSRSLALDPKPSNSRKIAGLIFLIGTVFMALGAAGLGGTAFMFFGSGLFFLTGSLIYFRSRLIFHASRLASSNKLSLLNLSIRNAGHSALRSMLVVGLFASAFFILISVGTMKSRESNALHEKKGGTGGYSLIAKFDAPIHYDLNSQRGRKLLAVVSNDEDLWNRVSFINMRANSGEDVSCRNLYSPSAPRILSVPDEMIRENAFSFASTLVETENPWELLNLKLENAAIPVIADYETSQWILHLKLKDTLPIKDSRGNDQKLLIVALLKKSMFQGELLIGEENFLKLFPDNPGFREILVKCGTEDFIKIKSILSGSLADFGADVESTSEYIRVFSKIADTYISAFEMLGCLGLILGTIGMAVVLVRSVLERRRELLLLSALGFRKRSVVFMVVAENMFLMISGAVLGTLPAMIAVTFEYLKGYSQGIFSYLKLWLFPFMILTAFLLIGLSLLSGFTVILIRKIKPALLSME